MSEVLFLSYSLSLSHSLARALSSLFLSVSLSLVGPFEKGLLQSEGFS